MDEQNIAWVPGEGAGPAPQRSRVARILRALGEAASAAARGGEGTAVRLHLGSAGHLLAAEGLDTLEQMQRSGELPYAGTPEWGALVADAETGNVEIVFMVIRRDRQSSLADVGAGGSPA